MVLVEEISVTINSLLWDLLSPVLNKVEMLSTSHVLSSKETITQFSLEFLHVEMACSWFPGGVGAPSKGANKI